MGTDKALIEIDGEPMATRVARALAEAAVDEVVAIGGDRARLEGLGLRVIDDRWPGEGPLGGVLTALESAPIEGAGVLAVCACDLRAPSTECITSLLDQLEAARGGEDEEPVAMVPLLSGRRRFDQMVLTAACHQPLHEAFAGGVRSLREGLSRVRVVEVAGLPERALQDVDRPSELPFR